MKDTKMVFAFNEERIAMDGEYTVDEVYSLLDHDMNLEGLTASSKGVYEGNYEEDYIKFMEAMVFLMNRQWFQKYCAKWIYINPEEGCGDVLSSMKDHNLCL